MPRSRGQAISILRGAAAIFCCLSFWTVSLPVVFCQQLSASGGQIGNRADEEWRLFREAFPFHMQTIAVCDPDATGMRILIASEPPPHVTLSEFTNVDPTRLVKHETKQWTIGFDGWVQDIVVELPPLEPKQLDQLVDKLSDYLYFSDYKSYALKLPADLTSLRVKYPVDLRVSTSDLETWYAKEEFLLIGGRQSTQLRTASPSVYLSKAAGLVAWVIPRDGLKDHKADARKFALDSDLILGAVNRRDAVIIFGRERIVPVSILPPLRTEMILRLAAVSDDSLSQSYERNLFSAGPSHGRWDWAPIYLSRALLDTEYGSLLNITDQMLKGWSEHGLVEYYNFPCPPPSRFPFDGGLRSTLKTGELLYNWNTKGFGIVGTTNTESFYAATRTGALPVLYQAGGGKQSVLAWILGVDPNAKTRRAEEEGYAYFATINEPYLARAVQYASLYQIFFTFEVYAGEDSEWPTWDQAKPIQEIASTVLSLLRSADDAALSRAAASLSESLKARLQAAKQLDIDVVQLVQETQDEWKELKRIYDGFFRKHGEEGEAAVAQTLVGARVERRSGRPLAPSLADEAKDMAREVRGSRFITYLCRVPELQQHFSESRTAGKSLWIRTPTVVFSRTLGRGALGIGGHNLDATVVRVVRDPAVQPGEIRIGDEGQILCNPKDAPIVERQARKIAKSKTPEASKSVIEASINNGKEEPVYSRSQVLALAEREFANRGMSSEMLLPGGVGNRAPPPPTKPPGTSPPSEPPPNEGDHRSFAPGDAEVLYISQAQGLATIRRHVENTGSSERVATDICNQQDLIYFLRSELEGGGRTHDINPLRMVFDSSFDRTHVTRLMETLALHESRANSGRIRLTYFANAAGRQQFSRPFDSAKVSENPDLAVRLLPPRAGEQGGAHAVGTLEIGFKERMASISFDVYLKGADPSQSKQAEASVKKTVSEAGAETIDDLVPAVYESLIDDLKAVREGSHGDFRAADIGDLHVTEFRHETTVLGLLAWDAR